MFYDIEICYYLVTYKKNRSNLQPPEVVGRVSETQLQVGENLNLLTQQVNG